MNELDLHDSIIDWVRDFPAAIPILERYGIDYSCGGKSLAYSCEQRGVDPLQVVGEIHAASDLSGGAASSEE